MVNNWHPLIAASDSAPLLALDLTRRLYRAASPHEAPPTGAEVAEKLRQLALQIDRKTVTIDAVLQMIWTLLLYGCR